MIVPNTTFTGIVRGKTIELDRASGFPDGQAVSVQLRAEKARGDGLRDAFGAWADDSEDLDGFIEQLRLARKASRGQGS